MQDEHNASFFFNKIVYYPLPTASSSYRYIMHKAAKHKHHIAKIKNNPIHTKKIAFFFINEARKSLSSKINGYIHKVLSCLYDKVGRNNRKTLIKAIKMSFLSEYNYFQSMIIYFQVMIIFFQSLIIYFQGLKIIFCALFKTFVRHEETKYNALYFVLFSLIVKGRIQHLPLIEVKLGKRKRISGLIFCCLIITNYL